VPPRLRLTGRNRSRPPFGVIITQFVDANTGELRPATITSGTITIANNAPVFTDATIDETLDFGDSFVYNFAATDADAPARP